MMPKKDGKVQEGDTDYIDIWKAMKTTLKSEDKGHWRIELLESGTRKTIEQL